MERNLDGDLKWYEGPEWEGWIRVMDDDEVSSMILYGPPGKICSAIVCNIGQLVLSIGHSRQDMHNLPFNVARQIGEAWVKGWS